MPGRDASRAVGPGRVLVAGVSTRAVAESAARAGFDVTAIDAFGDLDHHPAVRVLSVPRDFGEPMSAAAAARAARAIECDAVVYVSSLDNHPQAVEGLAAGRALWGNPPSVLSRVRDPQLTRQALGRRGLPAPDAFALPDVRTPAGSSNPPVAAATPGRALRRSARATTVRLRPDTTSGPDRTGPVEGRWLVKPRASGGGHGVRMWRRGARVPRGSYLQQFVDGTPASVVFVAAARGAVPIGMTRQLVGEAAFGSAGYRYCGSILAPAGDPQFGHDPALFDAACALARAASEDFNLVGANGIDFIAHNGVAWPIEVNPRWTASMELVERAYGLSVFGAHAAACASGARPDFDLARVRRGARAYGKAVVFARHDVVLGDTRAWLEDVTVRDVPHPGESIRAGRPVCTVLADGTDAAACHAALIRRADRVYADLAAWARHIA